MDIFTTTSHLKSKLSEIGLQLEDINSTDDNANVANTAGIVTYLLTSNSKNQTLKTVGGITSIAAILYGSSERRKSNRIKKLYKQNILDLVGYVANFDGRILKSEKDAIKIREFLYCLLQISHYLDTLVSQDVSIVRGKGHLGKKNIEILMNLTRVNVFDSKIQLAKFFCELDKTISPFDGKLIYETSISQLNLTEIKKEGNIIRMIIIGLMITGVSIMHYDQEVASIAVVSGFLLWITNHFFPVFSNTRQLKKVANEFLIRLESTVGRESLNYTIT
jgi:hypothetical protein